MTKQEERKVLAQIEKLIASTGTGSYLAMAFEGCVELARTNIDNDWGCSLHQRIESLEQQTGQLVKDLQEKVQENDALRARCEGLQHTLEQVNARLNSNAIRAKVEQALRRDVEDARAKMDTLANQIADMAEQDPAAETLRPIMERMAAARDERMTAQALLRAFVEYK